MQVELLGTPCVMIATEVFATLATREAEAFDMPDLAVFTVPHPIATLADDEIERLAEDLVPKILGSLVRGEGSP